MNSKNNNIVTVIQSVAKNLGNTHLMCPRSFTPFRMTMLAAAISLSFTACQNEEPLDAPVAKDALALLPADTPVGMVAELKAQSRAAEADNNTDYDFTLTILGGSSSTPHTGRAKVATLGNAFSTLQLKHFNLVEGKSRCVSRWTVLEAAAEGYETLTGVARLTADANGLPTLNYTMQHTGTKVTVVLTNGTTPFSTIYGIGATLAVQNSKGMWKYGNDDLIGYLGDVKALNSDPAADDANIKLAIVTDATPLSPIAMTSANSTFTTIVPATPDGATLADTDVLTITVPDNYTGLTSPETGGTYTLKLKDVKMADGTNLTALKSGEHLTLTVTLQHNMLVQATATIGGWDVVSADVDLNQDPSKIPPYEYNAETKTYTVNEESYVKTVWDMKAADDKVKYDGMLVVDGSASIDALTSVINGAIAAGIKSYYVINELLCDEYGIPTLQTPILSLVGIVEGGNPDLNDPDIGTLSIVLADATQIPDWSFCECHALKSVSAPKATSVGNSAIRSCSGLEKVTLDAATTIGEFAFYNCTSLKELTFGSKITELGAKVFLWFNEDEEEYFSYTPNCALTLANGQLHMLEITPTNPISRPEDGYPVNAADEDAEENRRKWADYTWKSITIK